MGDYSIVNESSEIGDVIKEINSDNIEDNSNMSSIDMKTRLSYSDITRMAIIDNLVGFKVIPIECLKLTRQIKRLRVSLNGEGRKEFVRIINGERDHEENKSGGNKILDKIGGMIKK